MVWQDCDSCKHGLKGSREIPCNECSIYDREGYEPKTNADRIRNMTDEELAEWIHNMTDFFFDDCEPCKSIYDLDTKREIEIYDSYGDLLEWLQAEVKEGK